MRIALFEYEGKVTYGAVEGEAGAGLSGLTVAEIEGLPFDAVKFTGQRFAAEDVRFRPPIYPSKVVCVGRNYADHAAEHNADVPPEPLLFLKPSSSIIGQNDVIRLPEQSQHVEHEAELAIIIGASGASRIDRSAAAAAIFGYTCANDVSARDLQYKDGQWTRAKGFDSFCPLGPWIATGIDAGDLELRCEVNDEVRQLSRTKNMIFDVPTLVSYISHVMTLLPGDVILTGTPAGVSPIESGDTVTVSIENIGTLSNKVLRPE